ncbi:hypothetical protein CHU98_g12548 [Xylaria longipes]|nr:hypothetical protein CHU98_g12548 [Xylaria longipes]
MRWRTSGLRPSDGHTTTTWASALRRLRILPAATCAMKRCPVSAKRVAEDEETRRREDEETRSTRWDRRTADLAAANDQDGLVLDLPGQDQTPAALHVGELLLSGVGHVVCLSRHLGVGVGVDVGVCVGFGE